MFIDTAIDNATELARKPKPNLCINNGIECGTELEVDVETGMHLQFDPTGAVLVLFSFSRPCRFRRVRFNCHRACTVFVRNRNIFIDNAIDNASALALEPENKIYVLITRSNTEPNSKSASSPEYMCRSIHLAITPSTTKPKPNRNRKLFTDNTTSNEHRTRNRNRNRHRFIDNAID